MAPARRPTAARLPARWASAALFHALRGTTRVAAALPARWILRIADAAGEALYHLDARGRAVGRQNMDVFFGDQVAPEEKRRILKAALREGARAVAVLLHAAPLTPGRFRAWVDVPEEVERPLREAAARVKGAVIVSAHVGNWEILIGFATFFREAFPFRFLAEATFHPAIDRFLAYVRGSGGGETAPREGGALALQGHLRRGGIVGLVVDRNARRNQGGIYAPFAGLPACTTPLPAWLARRFDVPIAPLFCLPKGDGRYRMALGPEVSMGVRTSDFDADVQEITTRVNRLIEEVIRSHPEAWNWTLKRFKSRPTRERGDFPPYSLPDP